MTETGEIRYSLDDGLAHIRLNAPSRLNALTPAMMEAMVTYLAEADRSARAVLLTGAGRSFCAGVDLSAEGAVPHAALDGGAILASHVNPMILAIRDLRIPVVCAVQGAAAGLGMALALSCDLIVLGRSAYFLAPFARIGLLPDGGIAQMLVSAVGRARAAKLLLTAERLPADRALEWGLACDLVEDDELATATAQLASKLAAGPTVALAGTRQLISLAIEGDFAASLELERELQRAIPATLDCQEGHRAFVEKRQPRFVGR